jgi:DNA-binding XRE family transcriptional regulator
MATKKPDLVLAEVLAAARRRAEQTRRQLEKKPAPADVLTAQELADAAPFYFVLRNYICQLKEVRESAGLTLADISTRSGIAVESLSRLETGAQTNPTWKTLGLYAAAVGCRPELTAEPDRQPVAPRKRR